ncbi:hypothetical protein [Salinarchaeum chitinilyticum]
MSGMGRSAVSVGTLFKVAAIAALAVAGGQFLLDVLVDLLRHSEIRFDEGDRIVGLVIGALTTAAIVAGAYWIVEAGTEELVVAQAAVAVYGAAILEALLRSLVFDWAEVEVWVLLTSLSTVLYFLTFVLAYRMAFEDRDVTDWDPSAITDRL